MSEVLVRTPDCYEPIFQIIEQQPECSTINAYHIYRDNIQLQNYDPCIYLSMAITSGGYARDVSLLFPEILEKNKAHGDLIADVVAQQYNTIGIKRSDILTPSTLGKVEGWGQAEYLLFWSHVITGLEPDLAAIIDRGVRTSGLLSLPGFSDKSLDQKTKWTSYKKLVDEYVTQFDKLPKPIRPKNIQAVLLILDPELSLGVNAERYLCHKLGLGEYVFEVEESLGVSEELERVRRLGATSLSIGDGTISGVHSVEKLLIRRSNGQYFRKSGIISGIVDRRFAENLKIEPPELQRTSAELWEEYYSTQ